ncbi:MAG: dienelactone hydrolase family protein [Verrucomicrobiota bacterium]
MQKLTKYHRVTAVSLLMSLSYFTPSHSNYAASVSSGSDTIDLFSGNKIGYKVSRVKAPTGSLKTNAVDVAIWYPTGATSGPKAEYIFGQTRSTSDAIRDAPVKSGSFPFLIYSHGVTGGGTSSAFICESLARKGFIVAAADHTDKYSFTRIREPVQELKDMKALRKVAVLAYMERVRTVLLNRKAKESRKYISYRPRQVKATIDYMLKDVTFKNHIDSNRVGMFGHSFGGWTTLSVLGTIPEYHDPRIKAAVVLSSAVNKNIFSREEMARIKVPVMFMYGESEVKQGRGSDREHFYNPTNSSKYLVGIRDAGHLTFAGGGKKAPPHVNSFLKNDPARTAITRYTVAFMQYYFGKDEPAQQQLAIKGNYVTEYIKEK